jgi:hypothetical protein
MAFDILTFLSKLLGAILGLLISLGWFFCSLAVAVYFDSWIIGVVMFLAPMVTVVIYRMGQK